MSIQSPSSSNHSSFSCWKYDVFLSFRGEDIRTSFLDHLYHSLKNRDIKVFKDDKELGKGEAIASGLFKEIEESRFAVVIFSRNYADSTSCLDEVVKIFECKINRSDEQMVFPIFYHVDPSDIRKQIGVFEAAFDKYEKAFGENVDKVNEWKTALRNMSKFVGWHLKDRHEVEFIEEIVNEISRRLGPKTSGILDDLVGIHSRLEKVMPLIDTGSDDVRMIGICGMGGIGKTTIVRVVYELLSFKFKGSSFLANVREISEKNGLIALQKQLLSKFLMDRNIKMDSEFDGMEMIKSVMQWKKVFVVIDDVVDINQLNKLAGKRSWFGSGSRIIITTRDEHLLRMHRVDAVYKVEALNEKEAFELFTKKAFQGQCPGFYMECIERALKYAGGLPLALDVLGTFFIDRPVDEWRSALKRLKNDSEKQILDILQISFDGLKETEKKIFLDIACFFKGHHKDYVTKVLDWCGFDPVIGISVLQEKSLITISKENELWMHDLLQEMGQQLVMKQCLEEPGKRSRIWKIEDVQHVLTKSTGTEAVEVISSSMLHLSISAKAFSKMTNLRLLTISDVQLPQGLEFLSNELRFLEWNEYPSKSLPSSFQAYKVVELNMSHSCIEQMWKGAKPFNQFKFLRFGHSQNLIKTPDFSGVPNLEELELEGCIRLCEIHESLLVHKKLTLLNLEDCTSLSTLGSEISMESLRKLELSRCSKLKFFPAIAGSMECLSELLLDGTAVKELPLSIALLSGLVLLNLKDCKNLVRLPSTINGLKSVQTLKLSGCSKLVDVPGNLGQVESLIELSLDGTAITELLSVEHLSRLILLSLKNCKDLVSLPSSINNLRSLETLNLSGCSKLENVPENLGKLECLEELDVSRTATIEPPSSVFYMKNLKRISFHGCKGVPSSKSWYLRFPISLMQISSDPVTTLRLPSLSGLCSLTKLDLSDCNLEEGAIPSDICNLISLVEINLSQNNFASLPRTICRLSKLNYIKLDYCKRLQSLPKLPSNIKTIKADNCTSLDTLSLSDALEPCSSDILIIDSVNCLLSYQILAFSKLKRFLEISSRPRSWLSFSTPGGNIPQWFSYQNEGSSIRIIRPPDQYNKNKFVGYAICCVFQVHEHPPTFRNSYQPSLVKVRAYDKLREYFFPDILDSSDSLFMQAVSDHLWLLYSSHNENVCFPDEANEVEFTFFPNQAPGVEVKRCGVHPIYVHEVEEFNQTTNEVQVRASTVWNQCEFDQEFVGLMKRTKP